MYTDVHIHEMNDIYNISIPSEIIDVIILFYNYFEWDINLSNEKLKIENNIIPATRGGWNFGFSKNNISKGKK